MFATFPARPTETPLHERESM